MKFMDVKNIVVTKVIDICNRKDIQRLMSLYFISQKGIFKQVKHQLDSITYVGRL